MRILNDRRQEVSLAKVSSHNESKLRTGIVRSESCYHSAGPNDNEENLKGLRTVDGLSEVISGPEVLFLEVGQFQ